MGSVIAVALACTTFVLPNGGVGKCYDWHMGQGILVVNKRDVLKRALPIMPGDRPASWTSRFASVTFNQYGREFPNGGMNEAGLVVEIMWLAASREPAPDERPTVNELQWIQYQLDRFATAGEVLAHAGELRVSRVHGKVHYLACDRGGACVAIEFLDGKLVATPGARVLTNDPYAASLAYLKRHAGFGGSEAIPSGAGSLERFARASSLVAAAKGALPDAAFAVLDAVNNDASQWHIVYDPVRLRVWYRLRGDKRIKWFDLSRFDGSCAAPAKSLDLAVDASGDVTSRFTDYDAELNRRTVENGLSGIGLPPPAIEGVARYPGLLQCSEKLMQRNNP